VTPVRRFTPLALGAALALASIKLAGCSGLDPNPPDPHEASDSLHLSDASPDAPEASGDAR